MSAARPRNAWFLAFLALLWLGATFAYFGDTGKHSDDYWFTGHPIDGTGIDWSNHPWHKWPYFWRPLHLVHAWVLNTVFWDHDWVMHLELAAVHAAVCVMLFSLLVRLGCARGPAMAAAVLFGTCPLLGEAIGWSSASCNAIGALFMLMTLELGRRFGSVIATRGASSRGCVVIAIMSFATACFYEPAAAGLAAMPLVVWAASPPGAGMRARMRRVIPATLAAGGSCAMYVALLLGTAPPGQRGAAETVFSVAPLHEILRMMLRSLREMFLGARGRDILLGSIEQGIGAAREHPVVLGILIATALAGIAALVMRWTSDATTSTPDAIGPRSRGRLLLLGAVLLIVPWAPFIAQHAVTFELRSLYVPLIGGAVLVAAAGNGLCRVMEGMSERGRGIAGLGATAAVGLMAIAGQVGLVGVQTQFRTNARHDALVAAQFSAIASRIEPGTTFMVLATDHRGAGTSRPTYNRMLHTALEAPWCAKTFVQRAMHRHDIHLVADPFWSRHILPIDHLTSREVRDCRASAHDCPIEWANVVPLWIDPRCRIHVVESLTLQPLNGPPLEVRPERAQDLARDGPSLVASVPDLASDCQSTKLVRLVETPGRLTRVQFRSGKSTPASGEPKEIH